MTQKWSRVSTRPNYIRISVYEDKNARDSKPVTYIHTEETRQRNGISTFLDERLMGRVKLFISYQETEHSHNHLAALVQSISIEKAVLSD
ncbi:Protein of unknown function [Pyronema omphalodes CBS 100304]|uniref:Uncharacterized protein n=1 Tax=Pyronema omphalodes (strain CBS 100304) TaxID=1076935 RepID=U4L0H3_PYROM|nr:Protein of unknown function [Pyronema omphalodes CBS 100304]